MLLFNRTFLYHLQAFEVWCEDSGGSGEAAKEDAFSALKRLLYALEETGTHVNVSTYPPVQYYSDMIQKSHPNLLTRHFLRCGICLSVYRASIYYFPLVA